MLWFLLLNDIFPDWIKLGCLNAAYQWSWLVVCLEGCLKDSDNQRLGLHLISIWILDSGETYEFQITHNLDNKVSCIQGLPTLRSCPRAILHLVCNTSTNERKTERSWCWKVSKRAPIMKYILLISQKSEKHINMPGESALQFLPNWAQNKRHSGTFCISRDFTPAVNLLAWKTRWGDVTGEMLWLCFISCTFTRAARILEGPTWP